MGCDIHWVLEQKMIDGKWVGIYSTDLTPMPKGAIVTRSNPIQGLPVPDVLVGIGTWHDVILKGRNYEWFGKLAGVRYSGPDPLGWPHDVSDLSQACIDDWGGDGHSHSYLPAVDFVARYLDDNELINHLKAKFDTTLTDNVLEWLGLDDFAATHPKDYRVVFWFDN
jgi:hypothetical protein